MVRIYMGLPTQRLIENPIIFYICSIVGYAFKVLASLGTLTLFSILLFPMSASSLSRSVSSLVQSSTATARRRKDANHASEARQAFPFPFPPLIIIKLPHIVTLALLCLIAQHQPKYRYLVHLFRRSSPITDLPPPTSHNHPSKGQFSSQKFFPSPITSNLWTHAWSIKYEQK